LNPGSPEPAQSVDLVNAIKHFFVIYKKWIMAALAPLGGIWAILIIALLDAAAFGIPLDPVVAFYVHVDPRRVLIYALVASAGSALGSTVPYLIGYKGGEALIAKRIGEKKYARVRAASDKYGDLALIVPAMMPPGFPFKLFVFGAGVAEMPYLHFLLAIFTGRLTRFLLLGALTIKFGPQIIGITTALLKQHLTLTLLVIAAIVVAIFLILRIARLRRAPGAETTISVA
jgi:membrane protein YqaA with SNARE-associated domain